MHRTGMGWEIKLMHQIGISLCKVLTGKLRGLESRA